MQVSRSVRAVEIELLGKSLVRAVAHVLLPRGGRGRVTHDEADVPVEGHVVRPFKQAAGPGFGIAGVVVSPQRVVAGGVVLVPQAAAGMRFEPTGIDRPLHGQVFRRTAEAGEILVRGELHRERVEHAVDRAAVEIESPMTNNVGTAPMRRAWHTD